LDREEETLDRLVEVPRGETSLVHSQEKVGAVPADRLVGDPREKALLGSVVPLEEKVGEDLADAAGSLDMDLASAVKEVQDPMDSEAGVEGIAAGPEAVEIGDAFRDKALRKVSRVPRKDISKR